MSLKPETIAQLQTLIQADPALVAQLQSCTNAASSAAVIVKAAAAKGIVVSEPSLVAQFEANKANQGAMSDAELEQVAGGGVNGAVFLSVVTLGVGCAIGSIVSASLNNPNCAKHLTDVSPF